MEGGTNLTSKDQSVPFLYAAQFHLRCCRLNLFQWLGNQIRLHFFLPGSRLIRALLRCGGTINTRRIVSITINMLLIITATLLSDATLKACMQQYACQSAVHAHARNPNKVECMHLSPKNSDGSNLSQNQLEGVSTNPRLTDSPTAWNIAQICFVIKRLRKIRSPYSASAEELFWSFA